MAAVGVGVLGAGTLVAQQGTGGVRGQPRMERDDATGAGSQQVMQHVRTWSEASRKSAKEMVEKYGPPQAMTDTMLVRQNNGPWKRTIVYSEALGHDFPMPHKDVHEIEEGHCRTETTLVDFSPLR